MDNVRRFYRFVQGSLVLVTTGNAAYWAWVAFLLALIVSGGLAYARQVSDGLVVTAMRDQVSWGVYIGNFTFLVGVAAAAVVLVIPAYVYDWKPIRQIVVYGELLAVSAIVMCPEVNLRSSTLLGFDGVEAIVPNSSLLENKVTNWTHTDNRVRRFVKVGVAYGSPVRRVAELLLDCMQRHGQVLKDPEPRVLFEEFGDSALVFAMYFWLEIRPGVNSQVVMSDLRFMVHKALEEAGIAVPFPQRDVHLDATRPLQVELKRGRPAAG